MKQKKHYPIRKSFYFSCLICSVLLTGNIHAAIFTVNSDRDINDINAGDGICETTLNSGICTLRAAIQESNKLQGADTINVPSGFYKIASRFRLISELIITDDLSIAGTGAGTTIIDGDTGGGVFKITSKNTAILSNQSVSISNVTIQHGTAFSFYGGGINVENNADLKLKNVIVRQNNAFNEGAGIYIARKGGALSLENCIVENNGLNLRFNYQSSGAGIAFNSNKNLLLRNSTVRGNIGLNGAGIYVTDGTTTIVNSTISNNHVKKSKSGFFPGEGGGISITNPTTSVTLVNSTISGNSAEQSGGGIVVNKQATLSLYNVTISNNRSSGRGGGIYENTSSPAGNISFNTQNSIIAGNSSNGSGPDCDIKASSINSKAYNLIGDDTNCKLTILTNDLVGTANSRIDPMLMSLKNNGGITETLALKPASPAINAGNPAGCLDQNGNNLLTDQRGFAGVNSTSRAHGAGTGVLRCDIGAYEVSSIPIAVAGLDQVVGLTTTVTLDGSQSHALNGISRFEWREISNNGISLSNINSMITTFIAPSISRTLKFELNVTDTKGVVSSNKAVVMIQVKNTTALQSKNATNLANKRSGGCTLVMRSKFDPLFILLTLIALFRIIRTKSKNIRIK